MICIAEQCEQHAWATYHQFECSAPVYEASDDDAGKEVLSEYAFCKVSL
jgi:hypothetical protein